MSVLNNLNICQDITEVISALKALKSGKAPGSDGIPVELLKLGILSFTQTNSHLLMK